MSKIINDDLYFFQKGGEMGKMIRSMDWAKTSIGDPNDWPSSLCTMVSVMLENPFGMYIAWGPEFIQLYNDAYRPILGSTKHPHALGISTKETFVEIWDTIGPMFEDVMKGNPVGFPDFMLPLDRNGFIEECYFDFSYSPIRKVDGSVGGILVTVIETTAKYYSSMAMKESNSRFLQNIMQAPVAMSIFRGKDFKVEIANDKMLQLWGKNASAVLSKPIFEGWPEAKDQGLEALLENVYQTGEKFVANERPVQLPRDGKTETVFINFVYEALREKNGIISGVVVTANEVTPQVLARTKVEESEEKVRALVENAPFPIAVYVGKEMRIELANEAIIKIWGKGDDVIGKRFKDLLPELSNQKVFEQIQQVFETGKSFHTQNTALELVMNGIKETFYFNYSFTPLYDLSGKIYGVMNSGVDLTDLNLAKQKIEETNKRFRNTVKQAPVGITILRGSDYVVEMANEAYLQLADRKEETFVGKPLFKSMPEVEETVYPLLNGVMTTGIPFHGSELPIPIVRFGKKTIRYYDFIYHPLKEDEGDINGLIVIATDVTEKVEARKIIEQNEERLNIVVDASELGTWELNLKTRELKYSKRYLEIIGGYSEHLILDHDQLLKHIHPDDLYLRNKAIKDAIKTGYLHYDTRLIWNDGSLHWMEAKGKVFYDKNQEADKIIGTIRDLTDERKHQRKLEESEKRFRDLIMQSPVPKAILKGKDLVVEMANNALLQHIWRKNASEVIGKKILEVFPELKTQKFANLLKEVYQNGNVYSESEAAIYFNHGERKNKFYIDFEFAPILETDGSISGIKLTAIDVTEKVEARKIIEESELEFRTMMETIPHIIWMADNEGKNYFLSKQWYNYTGEPMDESAGSDDWLQFVDDENRAAFWQNWTTAQQQKTPLIQELKLRSKSEHYEWFILMANPIIDADGAVIKWTGSMTNIQEQKVFSIELEKQVKKRTIELNTANKQLAENNDELQKMNKELQSFAYISSHDLQEPLRKIQTFATLILDKESKNLSEDGIDKFNRMQNAAYRMQTLINDLLSYSRSTTQERIYEKINLKEIIDEVTEELKEELQLKKAVINIGELCDVYVIPFQFRQLLLNLVSNSLKFSKKDVLLQIFISSEIVHGSTINNHKLLKDINYCHITLRDNGIGFEKEFNEKIFEVFQRLHGKHSYPGTGIGLAIVKKIVENHHGFISAHAVLGEGATFEIYIPAE